MQDTMKGFDKKTRMKMLVWKSSQSTILWTSKWLTQEPLQAKFKSFNLFYDIHFEVMYLRESFQVATIIENYHHLKKTSRLTLRISIKIRVKDCIF